MFNTIFPNIHREGYKFLAISIIATFIVLLFSKFLGSILIILTIWVYYFFRDPERYPINDDSFLVSPADGLITDISERTGPVELQLENTTYTKASIFMNVFNCHVNRTPLAGIVEEINYKPGKFLNASLDKASEENERNYYKIKSSKSGEEIIIVQIAGLIARRIVCNIKNSQEVTKGDRIGIIKFGSRVDLYLPQNYNILISKGQRVLGGETIISNPNNIKNIKASILK